MKQSEYNANKYLKQTPKPVKKHRVVKRNTWWNRLMIRIYGHA